MSKNIFSPYKFNKIGKIVANSVKIAEKYMWFYVLLHLLIWIEYYDLII